MWIHFAIADGTPTAEREQVPGRIGQRFNGGRVGRIEFVGVRDFGRLYRMQRLAAEVTP